MPVSEKTRAEDDALREQLRRADPEKLKKAIKAVVAAIDGHAKKYKRRHHKA